MDTEGELVDLIEEFSEGRIQFAFCKVKDPNTGLPKSALIAWVCGQYGQVVDNRLTIGSAVRVYPRGPRATLPVISTLSPSYFT